MLFLHIADLHIGKVLHKKSLLSDQIIVLNEIADIAAREKPDAVLIAGDIYQRSSPSAEAMTVFSDFLSKIAQIHIPCYIISGNHDSAERVSYLAEIAQIAGIHVPNPKAGEITSYPLRDEFGDITIHLMPFTTPMLVREAYPEKSDNIADYTDAVRIVLENHPITGSGRHVLVAHQFITGAQTSDSEELAIGGLDSIPASLFDQYDYVALGHLHAPQQAGRPGIRYAGSPMRYSFSEVTQKKSVTLVDLREPGSEPIIRTIPLHQPHDMLELRGELDELMTHEITDAFTHITLTDEEPQPDAARRLRTVFQNLLLFNVENSKKREDQSVDAGFHGQTLDFHTILRDFYAFQNNGAKLSESQIAIVNEILEAMDQEAGSL